jgi:hypothetical protein
VPLTIDERKPAGAKAHKKGLRASDKGYLPMSHADYIKLLTWTAKNRSSIDKRAQVPGDMRPILTSLGIDASMWSDLVWNYKKYFGRSSSSGSPEKMKSNAASHSKRFTPGQRRAQACFS